MSSRASGLTLVETLAATVLLTMIAVACIPLLRQTTANERTQDNRRLDLPGVEIGRIAESVLRQPSLVDAKNMDDLLSRSSITISWPPEKSSKPNESSTESREVAVSMRVMRRVNPVADDQEDSAWVEFRNEGGCCVRWVAIPAHTRSMDACSGEETAP